MTYEELTPIKAELDKLPRPADDAKEDLRKKVELESTYVSCCLDGATFTRKETARVLYGDETVDKHSLTEHIKVLNAAKAFELISDTAARPSHQIDDNDVKSIHRVVARNLDDKNGGMYRGTKRVFPVGTHEMPDSATVQRKMDEFGMWLFTAHTLHPAALAAEAHLRLMSVLPFAVGNGCTARCMMNLILMRHGYPPALFSRREKKEYWTTLENAIFKNDRAGYDRLICRAVRRALEMYVRAAQRHDYAEVDRDPYYMRIGQLAKESGERVSTLRYWTGLGLLETAGKTSADYTLYSSEVLPRIKRVNELKNQRFTLDEIRLKLQEDAL